MNTLVKRILTGTTLAGAALTVACGDGGAGPSTGANVTIRFGTAPPVAAGSFRLFGGASPNQLVITGSNGTLTITDIRLIVDEFELERTDVAVDCDVEPEPAGCADFEARFLFVDVPLTGTPLTVANQPVPAGTYKEMEFEVEDLETDADEPEDQADAALAQALLTTIRQTFPDWPAKASMVVVGTFSPTGGTARSFRAYFEAEIEVELEFVPPVVVGETPESFVVELSPALWFKKADGTVTDLSLSDFPTTQRLIQFELEIDDGFELEVETP